MSGKPTPALDELKRCGRCHEWLLRDRFGIDRKRPDGLNNRCRDCSNAEHRARTARKLAANPELARRQATERAQQYRGQHPGYDVWQALLRRCYTPRNPRFKSYGGRGIEVCDRWQGALGYRHFFFDMGERPSAQHSIDRIDNDGNYEPSNCRWATAIEQRANQRPKVFLATVLQVCGPKLAALVAAAETV